MLTVNDFFCGAGGMGLGFNYAGFKLSGAWDFDKYAVMSYRNNVSNKIKQEDITKMDYNDVPYADVWTFGFPCQDVSIAGKMKGMIKGETRSGLFYEIMRILNETKLNNIDNLPKVILAENVKRIKNYLPEIEKEFNKAGYNMYVALYNSKYFNIPQNRERYFILGVHDSINKKFIFKDKQTDFIPKLSSVLEAEVDEKYFMSDDIAKEVIKEAMKRVDIKGTHACLTPARINKRQMGRRAKEDEEEMFTLTAQDLHGIIINKNDIKVVGRLDIKAHDIIKRVYDINGISPTLTTSDGGHRQPKILTEDFKVRKLTPREYARLQGFPDTYEFFVSNRQLYKQFGNAVTVNVAEYVANQIKEFLK